MYLTCAHREHRVKMCHAKRVINVTQRVDKRGVALAHQVIEREHGLVLFQQLRLGRVLRSGAERRRRRIEQDVTARTNTPLDKIHSDWAGDSSLRRYAVPFWRGPWRASSRMS
jgi:hypothetical protein